jgi:hypothetical protein
MMSRSPRCERPGCDSPFLYLYGLFTESLPSVKDFFLGSTSPNCSIDKAPYGVAFDPIGGYREKWLSERWKGGLRATQTSRRNGDGMHQPSGKRS